MFDLYPRHSHRTPAQIAEDAGGSFEPMSADRGNREAGGSGVGRTSTNSTSSHSEHDPSANAHPADQPNR